MTKVLPLLVALLGSSTAWAYSGQSCSGNNDCSGYGEVCVKEYSQFGKCQAPSTGLQGSSPTTVGRNCMSDATCGYGETCKKTSKYALEGVCSK